MRRRSRALALLATGVVVALVVAGAVLLPTLREDRPAVPARAAQQDWR